MVGAMKISKRGGGPYYKIRVFVGSGHKPISKSLMLLKMQLTVVGEYLQTISLEIEKDTLQKLGSSSYFYLSS